MSCSLPHTALAGTAPHADALPPGTRLGEFEVLGLLGSGGFGLVYEALDHSLRRRVAIKEYLPAALAGRTDGQSLWVRSSSQEQPFQAGLAAFVDEARLLAQFDHPSLVQVFRFWEANQTAYMAMPLYRGMTLKQALAHMRTPPPEAWLRKVLWSVASALRVLHQGRMLHRDISPDNIFLRDQGPPVLLDLGAAHHAVQGSSHRRAEVLKLNYAPIEQHAGATDLQQGPWSDLYALGAVVHGCLCSDAPAPASQRTVCDRMQPFARVARGVHQRFGIAYSPPFVDAVAQCLALQPAARPQSVDAFLQAMDMPCAPAGIEQFDFRAELGSAWTQPWEAPAPAVITMPVPAARPHRSNGRVAWAMAGSLGALVMAFGVGWPSLPGARHTPAEKDVIAELALPPHQAMPAVAAQSPVPPRRIVRAVAWTSPAAPRPERAPGPDETCAAAGFFARTLCIHRECQTPALAVHPLCVESRQQQADEWRRQMYVQ